MRRRKTEEIGRGVRIEVWRETRLWFGSRSRLGLGSGRKEGEVGVRIRGHG